MDMKLCDDCGMQPASVHLTQIADGESQSMHLCMDCAKDKGISISVDGPLDEDAESSKEPEMICGNCSMALSEFREKGRLGCPQCYTTFASELDEMLLQVHGSCVHKGKRYRAEEDDTAIVTDVHQLREKLSSAIKEEKFELAASIRDKIRSIIPQGTLTGDPAVS